MTPPRFRSPAPLTAPGAQVELGEPAARHARVLRLAAGDAVHAFDADGREADARIASLSAVSLVVTLGTITVHARDPHAPVLVQCVPKGSKIDDIVRAATEAGAAEIHLAIAARSIARGEGARFDRLARIADEAARQSEAPRAPAILPPAPLVEVAARAPAAAPRIVLSPRTDRRLRDLLASGSAAPWLIVGPEGGLDDAETDMLVQRGWSLARLDTYVLRTEHAGPIAVALSRSLL